MNVRALALAAVLLAAASPAFAADAAAPSCKPQGYSATAVFGAVKCLFVGPEPAPAPVAAPQPQQPPKVSEKAKAGFGVVKEIAKEKVKEKLLGRFFH